MIIRRRTHAPHFTEYGRFKPILREDFRYCCAYCFSHESTFGALRNMTIDHFCPRSRGPHLLTTYTNLYYCCGECNTYKGDRWPSTDELAQDLRFFDICADDTYDHFAFQDAEVLPLTNPGRFTVTCLRLDRPALTARRRAVVVRFSAIVNDLARLDSVRMRATEIGGGSIDAELAAGLDAVRQDLLAQLRNLIFPDPLAA